MSDLLVDKQGHTTILTINRPEQLNALTSQLMVDLESAVREFQADPAQLVCIITGAGEKAFCAGADLKEMAGNVSDQTYLPIAYAPDIAGISACEKVTIAAINGLAVAGGLELAVSCDIRLATQQAWFGVFEVKHGIMAGIAANVLPRLMPIGQVMDLMLSGDRLSAQDAHRLGLVQHLAATRDELIEAALRKADAIARNSQAAVWGTKQVLKFWRNAMMAEQQRYYEAVIHRVLLSGDMFEGPRAFAERREPSFSQAWPTPQPSR